jgi:hypothetical protein
MDPDLALAEIRDALGVGDVDRARESFQALDGWLSGGGFLPADWQGAR